MAKESTLINVVREIGAKLNEAKQEKAGLEANRSLLQTRMSDTADELMKILNAGSLEVAFSKLAKLTELEVEFEHVMNNITECYESGDFNNFKEYTERANKIAEDMLKIKETEQINPKVEKHEPVKEVVENEEDDEEIGVIKKEDNFTKKEELKTEIKAEVKKTLSKVTFDEDDDDEDI